MLLDKEVQALIIALVTVGSVFGAAYIIRGQTIEPFSSIALLNDNCMLGDYPEYLTIGYNYSFCIYIYNHMGRAEYYKIVYKIGTSNTLPNESTSSPEPPLKEWRVVLSHDMNITLNVTIPFDPPREYIDVDKLALIFELWRYDTNSGQWVYTGRWVHIYVKPNVPLINSGG